MRVTTCYKFVNFFVPEHEVIEAKLNSISEKTFKIHLATSIFVNGRLNNTTGRPSYSFEADLRDTKCATIDKGCFLRTVTVWLILLHSSRANDLQNYITNERINLDFTICRVTFCLSVVFSLRLRVTTLLNTVRGNLPSSEQLSFQWSIVSDRFKLV